MNDELGKYLRHMRGKRSLRDIAKISGLSHTYIADLENGVRRDSKTPLKPSPETLKKLSDALGASYKDLMFFAGYLDNDSDDKPFLVKESSEPYITDHQPAQLVKIPIYGEIKAGYDALAESNIIGYELVSKDAVKDGQYFYLIVKGDSMIEEGIREGMRVLVRSQNTVQHGKIGVILVNGDEATLKRVFFDKDNVILQAANRDIPPKVVPIHEVRFQGQVTKVEFDV